MATETLKLLAIDDNPDNLFTLKAVVRDALPGAVVVTALNGPQGIALARTEDPDVILLDIVMPGMDGYAVCRALKADDRLRHIPVLILTALRADRESRILALEAGGEGFLTKPLDEVELIAQIRAMAKIKAANQMQQMEREQLAALVVERTAALEQELAERKRAEDELRQSEEKFSKAFQTSPYAITITRAEDGKFVEINDAFTSMTGITREEALAGSSVGLKLWVNEEDRQRVVADLRAGRAVMGQESLFRKGSGEVITGLFSAQTIQLSYGLCILSSINDITERKQAAEALRESEALLRTIAENYPNSYLSIVENDLTVGFTSGQEFKKQNLNPEQFVGMTLEQVFGDQAPVVREHYLETFRGKEQSFELLVNDQHQFYRAVPLYAQDGTISRILSVVENITERKRVEEALRKNERQLHFIMNNVPATVNYVNAQDLRYRFINRVSADLFGIAPELAIGKHVSEILGAAAYARALPYINRARAGERLVYENIIPVRGEQRWFSISYTPEFNEQGVVENIIVLAVDITERKQAEQRAFELALERERMALLTKFILDVSHEFRTPLSIMQTNVYLLERLEDPAKRQRKLAQIGDQVKGITRLVELLVEMARLDSGVPFTTAPADLNEWVSAEAGKVQSAAAAKGLTLHLALAPDLPPIAADGNRLSRALHELLDNAVRFTPAGGRVTVRTARQDDGVAVEVADTGPGIPPDLLPRIFERFYRQDVAHTTPGFGLGLPIARAIVERHGGRLEVESQPGAGSVFRIRLTIDD